MSANSTETKKLCFVLLRFRNNGRVRVQFASSRQDAIDKLVRRFAGTDLDSYSENSPDDNALVEEFRAAIEKEGRVFYLYNCNKGLGDTYAYEEIESRDDFEIEDVDYYRRAPCPIVNGCCRDKQH